MAEKTETRERLTLEDFDSHEAAFDPVAWLNSRLSKSNVPFEKLDQHLASLSMSCQLLCQDTSESIELASNQLVSQLKPSARDLERMRQEASKGYGRLGDVLEGMKDADQRKRSGLRGLAEIDAVKTRVETACSALREVGSWDRKVKDCESLVHAGNLPEALGQLVGLKGVLDAFRMLPEFARKSEQLTKLQEQLLSAARRRARAAVERSSAEELRACREVFAGLQRQDEAASIANGVFLDLCERAWQSQVTLGARAVFDALAQALEERWPLLQALEAPDSEEEPPPVTVTAVKAVLTSLSTKLVEVIGDGRTGAQVDEDTANTRASMAVGLLGVYVDGFDRLAQCAALLGRWAEVAGHEVLPWPLLREVVRFVLLRPMEDDSNALAPPQKQRPSEAVLAADSNATRLLQMPSTWSRRLESQGASQLAVPWLAAVDEANAAYWRQWDRLIDTFDNTLKARSQEASAAGNTTGFDPSFLQEVMQLHQVLHDDLPAKFASFQADTMQQVGRLRSSQSESAFSTVLKEKMKDPRWCALLGIPSEASLRSAADFIEGSAGTSGVLPAAAAALARAEAKVRGVVTRCCAEPVSKILRAYPEMQEWTRPDSDEAAHGPLQCITLVPEHLFSLMPQLEKSQESSLQWLPAILEASVDVVVEKVLHIKQLSAAGAQQLSVDLEYLRKVPDALGSTGGTEAAATRLRELLETVEFLAAQQRRKKECAAQGTAFVEESRAIARWAERPLRAAMGL
ncbi:unnamed protein product [Effrenium voratum]|uniref:Conserved oligomeric Golgi complex subunit 7 n=1 Tax=Effrenium voratum TaxID=2562239 RepID=A0AA36JRD1_9DINO|nr:unnamed protein product [Effrenium voratum]